MKKQLLSKIILSCIMFGAIHAYGSSIADQIYDAKTMEALNPLKTVAQRNGDSIFDLWARQKQAISTGSPLTKPSYDTAGGDDNSGGGGAKPQPQPQPQPQVQVPGGGAPAAASKLSDDDANVTKFAQCVQIAGELLYADSGLGGVFASIQDDSTDTNIKYIKLDLNSLTSTTNRALNTSSRKSYNLGTLGKQPADHGKKGKRAAMTSAEKKRHKDLADRKNGRHNKVMQDKKAPHKKAAARGGKKAGNVKAQAMNNQHRKVS